MIRSLLNGIQDLVYPPFCINCRTQRLTSQPFCGLCADCTQLMELNCPPYCVKCNRHQPGAYPAPLCRNCREHPRGFDFAYGACRYTPYLRRLLHQFKFHQKTYLRHVFVQRMADYVRLNNLDLDQFDAILPVPLAPARLRERGYNQSYLLAELLAHKLSKPLWEKSLLKSRHTVSQASLSRKERFTNLEGAFRINPSKRFWGTNILIVDDLLTTGATAASAAHAVKAAGADTVAVLTLAIA